MDRKNFLNTLITPSAPSKNRAVQTKNNAKERSARTAVQQPAPDTPLYLQSGLNPYTGTWTTNERIHLLKRLSFGAVKEDVDYFNTLTYSQAVDEMLNTTNTSIGLPLKTYTPDPVTTLPTDPDWGVAVGQTWVNIPTNSGSVNSNRTASLKHWWLNLQINQPRSIEEKMLLFLSSHVTVEFDTVANGMILYKYLNTLRTNALGNYKQLIKAITLDPAMLIYLNGRFNTKTAPDENYGRELQELFTIGRGPGSGYTEADVKAASRVLTGYTVNTTTATSAFDPARHDTTNKQFSAFYGNKIITGQSGVNGQNELDELLNMIFATNEVALYICRRLYRFFVYGNIDSTIENNVIVPLAAVFRNNNYELKPVLSALFKSEHFFDVLTQGAMIKSPADFIVGMVREMKIKLPPAANSVIQYRMLGYLGTTTMAAMNQSLGDPPNVSGWQAYYQEPLYDKSWLDTDSYTKRRTFITTILNGYTNSNQRLQIDPISIAKRMSKPSDPNVLIQDFVTYFLRMPLSDTAKAQIKKDTLLTGQTTDSYWTTAWDNYMASPNSQANINEVTTRLKSLCNYFLFLEEYHLM
ncbi:DUF1800 domain-containing protein [Segetibacter sp. 3557_3]|uniref:DUF1800 domain-containing protein n=1 Tax=Segetibacter sp. 3557_3 TaxID=2547429 RepID=UPI001058941F|nr:DUF1800 domain-containing protein [Segetibacter sp. 3557_3]TDH21388.1 DUF1800 domain-containing protein [Segetibacter sp. 3557_3]